MEKYNFIILFSIFQLIVVGLLIMICEQLYIIPILYLETEFDTLDIYILFIAVLQLIFIIANYISIKIVGWIKFKVYKI